MTGLMDAHQDPAVLFKLVTVAISDLASTYVLE